MPESIAITGVGLVSMEEEATVPDQTVVVRDGRIEKIGDAPSVQTTGIDRVIDGRGRYLLPGLVDMHVHAWCPADLQQFLLYGVTSVRNMWGSPLQLIWRRRIDDGSLLGPTIFTSGPLMDGDPPVWTGSEVVRNRAEATESVRRQKTEGYDCVKVYSNLSAEAYEAIVEEGRNQGLPIVGHVPRSIGLAGALERRQDSIEHLEGYLRAAIPPTAPSVSPPHSSAWWHAIADVDSSRFRQLAEATRDAGVWNCVTSVVHHKFVEPKDAPELLSRPEIRLAPPIEIASWTDYPNDFRIKKDPPEAWIARRRAIELGKDVIRALRGAGAPILLGSDTPNPFVLPGFSIHEELRYLVEAGLSPYEALRAGTADAATFLRQESEFGTVTVGKRADLLLVRGDPLEAVRNASQIDGVMVRGRWIPSTERGAMVERLTRSYALTSEQLLGRIPKRRSATGATHFELLIRASTVDLGAETWSLSRIDGNYSLVASSLWNNAPNLDHLETRLEWDETGTIRGGSFTSRRSEGTWKVGLAKKDGRMMASVTGPDGGKAGRPTAAESSALILTPSFGSFLPLIQRLWRETPPEKLSVPFLRFEHEPGFTLIGGTLEVWAVPDEAPHDAGSPRRYEFLERRRNGEGTGRFAIDPKDGAPIRLETTDQDSTKSATVRAPMSPRPRQGQA